MLTIVISVYNEQDNLEPLIKAISQEIDYDKEVIFVNDGSSDNSFETLKQIKENYSSNNLKVKIINFSRNFGHDAAMYAGMSYAKNDFIVCMDADLQHPPNVAKQMLEKAINENLDIVLAKRITYQKGFLKKFYSKLFYKFINLISPMKFEDGVSDFFLIKKKIKDIVVSEYKERHIFVRGIIQNLGFKKGYFEYNAYKRFKGNSSYSTKKLLELSVKAIVSFSKMPLYISLFLGIIFGLFSFVVGIYTLIMKFVDNTPPGYTTIVVLVSFMFSMLFFVLGIIGLYIGYMFEEQKKRPLFIIEKIIE